MDAARLYTLYDGDPEPIRAFLAALAEQYDLPRGLGVLDMGCGPGRMLRPLAGLGWRVTGYEPDPDFAAAAERVAAELDGARVVRGGFDALEEEGRYDLIAAVNGPLSYVLDMGARRDAIARCARALRPAGVLFLDLANFWWILGNYRAPPVLEYEVDGVTVTRTAVHEHDFVRGVLTHVDTYRWSDADGDHEARKTHRMALLGPAEIDLFLADAGFVDVRTYNSWDDRVPVEPDGRRIRVAARIP